MFSLIRYSNKANQNFDLYLNMAYGSKICTAEKSNISFRKRQRWIKYSVCGKFPFRTHYRCNNFFYCRGKYPSIFCHIVFKIYCIKILKGSNYHHHPYLSHSTFQTDNHQKGLKCIFWYKLLTATSICSHKLNEFVLTKNC